MPPILLLHLSDLHFGPHSRFQGEKPERLGKSFHRTLAAAQKQLGIERKVDLVFVTGDIAEAGKKSEFERGREFLTGLAGAIGIEHRRFAFVPGNHDVNWAACKGAEAELEQREQLNEENLRRRLDEVKLGFYEGFLRAFYGTEELSEVAEPIGFGARLYSFPDLPLAVAALNSCERESHRKADHVGEVGEEQAQLALNVLRRPDLTSWFKVVAVHHNPVVTTPNNLELWREELLRKGTIDADLLARFESDAIGLVGHKRLENLVADGRAHLVLHGHHHAKDLKIWPWRSNGHACLLSAGSLWLQQDKLPPNEPASARLILLDPAAERINVWSLVFTVWARTEGEVEPGAFTLDPAGSTGFPQRLDLPEGYKPVLEVPEQRKRAATPVDTEFLRAFRQRFAEQYAPWDLGSLGAVRPGGIHEAKEARLDEMYLELRFDPRLDPENTDLGKPLRVEDLLNRHKPLALTGAAGAGKTTWARYTFRQLLKDERTLPLMLVLRDVARNWQRSEDEGERRSIDAALDDWIGAQMGGGWKGRLAKALEAMAGPRPILLVDGWDELGPLGEKFRDKLMGFLRANPRVLAVVTSRPYGEQKPSHADGFEKLEVQPLSNADIDAMTRKFFAQFSADEGATQKADLFLSALERATEARALARTPLLLTMMLLVGYSQPLPDKRHQLYATCIDTLLHGRPKQKEDEGAIAGRNTWCPTGLDQRRRWVAAIAYRAQTEEYEQIKSQTWRERASIVRTWKELASFLPDECPADSRDGFLAWLVEVAGLLVERTDGTLAFTHLSFQEYLTALHLATTAADHDQRLAAFRSRIDEAHWWETLRLLAAQIDSANPEFLEFALRALLDEEDASEGTLSFLGTVLADGLGSESLFRDWSHRYLQLLTSSWPYEADLCARAWLATRQEERKGALAQDLDRLAASANWLGWQRCGMFGDGWAPVSATVSRATTRGIVSSLLTSGVDSREAVAAGRILVGSHPVWPADHDLGALHLWPGHRRHAGLRLQSAAATGAPRETLIALARNVLIPPVEDEEVRALARDWAQVGSWTGNWAGDWTRDLARDWTSDWGRDLARGLAGDWSRYLARNWARYLAGDIPDWGDALTRNLTRELTRDWALYRARKGAREWARNLALGWVGEWERNLAFDWAHEWAKRLDLDSHSVWFEIFALTEFHSHGRALARGFFAPLDAWEAPLQCLLSRACRISIDLRYEAKFELTQNPKGLDPLWPALARHLARMSAPEDKALLEALARGDEKRPEPLSWGLLFIVRGDVMLDDGSVVTLDELSDEAGVPRLPFLEQMEPELEVDWDAEEKA
ncbi:MAG TPA: metallophosphoesterase [Thermoanaerobaculia bacterium]|jgi:3',5'-cyclic AMP phosphodiesterase CpdA|nr:metallophosphoesterase [Thermoanaerobaculia bacterium]